MAEIRENRFASSVALLISLYFPPERSGGSTGAWNRAMMLHKIGYSVFVLSGFPAYPTGKVKDPKYKGKFVYIEYLEPFTVIRLRLPSLEHTGFLKRFILFLAFTFLTITYLRKILRLTNKINIVYARAPIIFSCISGFVYSKLANCLFVYEAPDLWPEELIIFKTHFSFIVMRLGKYMAKLSYALPDIIVTVSQLASSYISEQYRPKPPIYCIPVGVDPTEFPKLSKSTSRMELVKIKAFPPDLQDKFIVLYSGLISSAQRIETLGYAALKLKDQVDIAIVIIGEGHEKQKLHDLKTEYNLDNLYILPAQPRNMMPTIISSADICTIVLCPEPIFDVALPTKFYEYLACCKPLIGICSGELADIINSSTIGQTVKAGDIVGLVQIIKELKQSPAMMNTMQKNSLSILERFSLDTVALSFKKLLSNEYKLHYSIPNTK
jgi:glycosyltransferase involved in cell wall biosynthesis